jgi:hypothetical protein
MMSDESRLHAHGARAEDLREALFGGWGMPRCARCCKIFNEELVAYGEQFETTQSVEELVLLEQRVQARVRKEMV